MMQGDLHECGQEIEYNEKWDAHYCKECNIWLERGCSDDCLYFHCSERPKCPNGQ